MCLFTKCRHHLTPAVEWLERDYDQWAYESVPGWHGHGFEVVKVAHQSRLTGSGLQHDQPMIRIKDDTAHLSSVRPERYYHCVNCEDGEHPHHCYVCQKPITHMAGDMCPKCWWVKRETPET